MHMVQFGLAAGASIPTREIVPGVHMPYASIGTWTSGTTGETENATDIVTKWLELGHRGIDTALIYNDQAEIGRVIASSGLAREDLFITSKIPVCEPLTAGSAVESDLNKLNVSYIDLMLIHSAIGFPGMCAATWKVLEGYVATGQLRAIGVSNYNADQLQDILDSATVPVAVNQIEYNPFSHDENVISFCHQRNITVEAWSPLGGGSGGKTVFSDSTIQSIASSHGVSAAQVGLRWIVQRGDMYTVLSSNQDHQANDADVWSFSLNDEEMQSITEVQNAPSHLVV